MLKEMFWLMIFSLVLITPSFAQKPESSKLVPKPLTEKQDILLKEGVRLHDAQEFDKAIEKYETILKENPDSPETLYELSYTYYAKGNLSKALDYAYKAVRYESKFLPLIYNEIGNVQDDSNEPKKAIEAYQLGLKLSPDDYLLNFNLAVTNKRLGKWEEARALLKKSAGFNPKHASSQFVLANLFKEHNYPVPALLAASRFFILEPNTERTDTAMQIIFDVLQGGARKGNKSNEINILANPDSPKDEGDFSAIELFLGLGTAAQMSEKDKNKTEAELLTEQFDGFIAVLSETKSKDTSKFVWKYYVPYFVEMKRLNLVETFANMLSMQKDDPDARKWLSKNENKLVELLEWSKAYQFPSSK